MVLVNKYLNLCFVINPEKSDYIMRKSLPVELLVVEIQNQNMQAAHLLEQVLRANNQTKHLIKTYLKELGFCQILYSSIERLRGKLHVYSY